MRQRPLRSIVTTAVLVLACGAAQPSASAPGNKKGTARDAPKAPRAPAKAPVLGAGTVERVKRAWEIAIGGKGRAVAVSKKLGRVAAASGSPLYLLELRRGGDVKKLAVCADVVRGGIGFFGKKLVVVCENGIEVWDPKALTREQAPELAPARITAAALQPPHIALGQHDGVIRILSLEGGPATEIRVPGPPIDVKSLALTRDASHVAVAWVQGSVWWWSTAEPETSHQLVRHEAESDAVAFSRDGSLLAEEGKESFTTVWAFGDPATEKAAVRNGQWVKRIHFTDDSSFMVRGGSDGLELAEIAGPRRIALDTRDPVEDVGLDESSGSFAAIDRSGRVTYWSIK